MPSPVFLNKFPNLYVKHIKRLESPLLINASISLNIYVFTSQLENPNYVLLFQN